MTLDIINLEDDLEQLMKSLPSALRDHIKKMPDYLDMIEVILDLGTIPQVRFSERDERLVSLPETTQEDIDFVVAHTAEFNLDNRAGIERTLHRISAIRNRTGKILGLTLRVGRAIVGSVDMIADLIQDGQNILLLGAPGGGKTTKLREASRFLSDVKSKRVMIVDTSNEIAGEGDIAHPGIGFARRMQVPQPDQQHRVMIEAVENHMPQVIVVDEIGTELEAAAARTIAERGVQLLATAHGYSLENVIKNPTLSDLVGGVQSVILGDEEAKFRGTQKTVLERKTLPTFDVLIELRSRNLLAVYHDVRNSVDLFLQDGILSPEIREFKNGKWEVTQDDETSDLEDGGMKSPRTDLLHIFPFGLNKEKVATAINTLQVPAIVSHTLAQADLVLAPKSQVKGKSKINQILDGRDIPLHVIKRNSGQSILDFLKFYFKMTTSDEDLIEEATREIHQLCKKVLAEKQMYEADPQPAEIRRVQHEYVEELGLNSMSVGKDPNRRVRVYPGN